MHGSRLIWNVKCESISFENATDTENDGDKLLHGPHCPGSHTTQTSAPTINFNNFHIERSESFVVKYENGCVLCKCGFGYDINETNNGFVCECGFIKIVSYHEYHCQLLFPSPTVTTVMIIHWN